MLFTDVWRIVLQCYAANERDISFAYGGNDNLLQVIRLYIFDGNDEISLSDLQLFRSYATAANACNLLTNEAGSQTSSSSLVAASTSSSVIQSTKTSVPLSNFFSKKSVSRIKYTNEPIDTPHRLAKLIDEYKRYRIMRIALTLRKISAAVEVGSVTRVAWVGESLFRRHVIKTYNLRKSHGNRSTTTNDEEAYYYQKHDSRGTMVSNRWIDATIEENDDNFMDRDDDNFMDGKDDIDYLDHEFNDYEDVNDDDDDCDESLNNDIAFHDDDSLGDTSCNDRFDCRDVVDDDTRSSWSNYSNLSDAAAAAETNDRMNSDVSDAGGDGGDGTSGCGNGDQFNNFKTVSRAKKIASCPTARFWYVETYRHFFNKIFATCRKVRSETDFREAFVF